MLRNREEAPCHYLLWKLLTRKKGGICMGGLRTNWRQSENLSKVLQIIFVQGMHVGITFMHNQSRSQLMQ